MKLLLLTSYYPPDLSAGSFRASALVDALLRVGGEGIGVDVLTGCPHRYASYRKAVSADPGVRAERDGSVIVTRLPVGAHNNRLADRALRFPAFAARAIKAVRGKRYDLVVATTSRLLTGYLGSIIAQRMAVPYYLDVRDLFVHNLRGMLRSKPTVSLLLPFLTAVERSTFERAIRVNLVSEGFLDYCRNQFPQCEYSLFSNGVDREFLEYDFSKPPEEGPRTILYAGNIGLGQGLERTVPDAARRLGSAYRFRIIGDGGQRSALERRLREARVGNVTLLDPTDRETLKREYRDADILLLPLNDYSALDCALPSKLFEYAATGKPILAGVRGYAKRFISAEVDGVSAFEPGDAAGLVNAVLSLEPGQRDRERFKEKFSRERLMDGMAADILAAVASERRGEECREPTERAASSPW